MKIYTVERSGMLVHVYGTKAEAEAYTKRENAGLITEWNVTIGEAVQWKTALIQIARGGLSGWEIYKIAADALGWNRKMDARTL